MPDRSRQELLAVLTESGNVSGWKPEAIRPDAEVRILQTAYKPL